MEIRILDLPHRTIQSGIGFGAMIAPGSFAGVKVLDKGILEVMILMAKVEDRDKQLGLAKAYHVYFTYPQCIHYSAEIADY